MILSFISHIITWPYRLALWFRHKCYDWGLLKSFAVDIPVISIGNITVGGTGKTPHTELVLRLLSQEVPVAVLSRGYKRSSKGFRYVETHDHVSEAGDEPLQIKRKFPAVVVAVDANRIAGINRIRQDHPQVKLIVLDDALQYRRLRPAYTILLSDYYRPYTQDRLLPFGRLRDLKAQASRADIIIVSKTPPQISSSEREHQYKLLKPNQNQKLLFSCYIYKDPCPLFPESAGVYDLSIDQEIIALTGIAQPKAFVDQISQTGTVVQHLQFSDHHHFGPIDIRRIHEVAAQYPDAKIFTTEKDAVRLMEASLLSGAVKARLYFIPIQVDFLSTEECRHFKKSLSLINFF